MPILALHGFTGSGSDFAPVAKLCGGNWHCPDLPGHGDTTSAFDCSPEAVREFIQQQLLGIASTTPNVLLGYSMGARAALLHATTYPEHWDALILISANPGIEDAAERAARALSDEALAQRIEREGIPSFLQFWQAQPLIRSQQHIRAAWQDAMHAKRLQQTAVGLAASLRQFGQAACPNLWPELSKITCPVLLITGEQDGKYRAIAERMQIELADAKHITIPRAGHMPHLEVPDATTEACIDFLRSI
jgi:2-succinyl-6-hydroxy-2,4-cyclohexadiene-1-carboxylate synthase